MDIFISALSSRMWTTVKPGSPEWKVLLDLM